MSPRLKPLFGSGGRNDAGRGTERLCLFVAALWAYFGLGKLRVGRWSEGIMEVGLALLLIFFWRRDRIKRS